MSPTNTELELRQLREDIQRLQGNVLGVEMLLGTALSVTCELLQDGTREQARNSISHVHKALEERYDLESTPMLKEGLKDTMDMISTILGAKPD